MSNKKANWLFFVDTNIFLDFYRQPGASALRQLAALEKHRDRLITGDQVRMEFLRNRQNVVVKALRDMSPPSTVTTPQLFADMQAVTMLKKHTKGAKEKHKEIINKAGKVISEPALHDEVFKTFNRIFDTNNDLNLCRPKKQRFEIRNLARKRFILGYPPRKSGDTSIGDAINWEWVVRCAQESKVSDNIMIVSRDGDFGAMHDGKYYLNDWLVREFKDRVSRKRKIVLTGKLTEALKLLDETVSPEDEKVERDLIAQSKYKTLSHPSDNTDQRTAGIVERFFADILGKNTDDHVSDDDDIL